MEDPNVPKVDRTTAAQLFEHVKKNLKPTLKPHSHRTQKLRYFPGVQLNETTVQPSKIKPIKFILLKSK